MVLNPEEYDQSYFDGRLATYKHNAGYGKYARWYRGDADNPDDAGELFKEQARRWVEQYSFTGKLLDVGCAKGFHVKDFRDLGVDAWGVDVSSYAVGEAEPAVAPYLTVANILTHISSYKRNEWDVIFSARFLECISEADLPGLIDEMNRVSRYQVHIIDEQPNSTYYLAYPLSWWAQQGFNKGTRLVSRETGEVVIV